MQQTGEIQLRADSARAPCIAYWLLVFACLMVHCFPVKDHVGKAGYNNHSVVASLAEDDWVPPGGVNEVPILPSSAIFIPDNEPAVRLAPAREYLLAASPPAFDARGPPVFI